MLGNISIKLQHPQTDQRSYLICVSKLLKGFTQMLDLLIFKTVEKLVLQYMKIFTLGCKSMGRGSPFLKSAYVYQPVHSVRVGCSFSSSKGMVTSMTEVQQAVHFYEQKNIPSALQLFERAVSILPPYIEGNHDYNAEHAILVEQLVKCYAWKGDVAKIQKVIAEARQKPMSESGKVTSDIMGMLNGLPIETGSNLRQIGINYSQIRQSYAGGKLQIQSELVKSIKVSEPNAENLESWLHGDIRKTVAFLMTSLLSKQGFYSNPGYNKTCSTLLKNTQRSSQKNVIKALLLMTTNLLRSEQFIQAEGMLQYCLDRKKQNLSPFLLKTNQEYILLNLLLSKSLELVNRKDEGSRLVEEYASQFDLLKLLLQIFLLDSI